jgi:polyhydroxyalkanoate synthesis regulator phasin
MVLQDVRKTFEATIGMLTPAKAQQLAKDLMDPGTAKEQIAKSAADLMEWSQSNRERMSSFIRAEIADQMKNMGVATSAELDALKKRVRDLERDEGKTASGRKAAARKPGTHKTPARRKTSTAQGSGSKRSTAPKSGNGSGSTGA